MKCENCNKEHDGSYGSGRFCCKKCAMSWSTKFDNKKETKWLKCYICGKDIEVNKRSSPTQVKCDICKSKNNPKKPKFCKVCGQIKPCLRPDICKKNQIIPTLVKYFGFNEDKIGTIEVYKEFDRIKNLLIEDYWNYKLSVPEMVEKYHHKNSGSFHRILKTMDIKKRNFSEAGVNLYSQGKRDIIPNNFYKYGWHTTWNNKQIFYRSSYELEFAIKLDDDRIDYEVEKLRILYWDTQKLHQRVAIPDFYLPNYGMIIEVKSNWTYDEQNMKDKFKSYKEHDYSCKLILDKKEIEI